MSHPTWWNRPVATEQSWQLVSGSLPSHQSADSSPKRIRWHCAAIERYHVDRASTTRDDLGTAADAHANHAARFAHFASLASAPIGSYGAAHPACHTVPMRVVVSILAAILMAACGSSASMNGSPTTATVATPTTVKPEKVQNAADVAQRLHCSSSFVPRDRNTLANKLPISAGTCTVEGETVHIQVYSDAGAVRTAVGMAKGFGCVVATREPCSGFRVRRGPELDCIGGQRDHGQTTCGLGPCFQTPNHPLLIRAPDCPISRRRGEYRSAVMASAHRGSPSCLTGEHASRRAFRLPACANRCRRTDRHSSLDRYPGASPRYATSNLGQARW